MLEDLSEEGKSQNLSSVFFVHRSSSSAYIERPWRQKAEARKRSRLYCQSQTQMHIFLGIGTTFTLRKDWRDLVEVSNHRYGHCRNRRRNTIACHYPNHGATTTMTATTTADVAAAGLSDFHHAVAIDSTVTHQMAAIGFGPSVQHQAGLRAMHARH